MSRNVLDRNIRITTEIMMRNLRVIAILVLRVLAPAAGRPPRFERKGTHIDTYAATATKVLEGIGKNVPSTAAAIEELRKPNKEMATRSGDLDIYFAKHAEMKSVFFQASQTGSMAIAGRRGGVLL